MEENLVDMDKYVDPFIMKDLICNEIKNNGMDYSDILQIKEFVKNVKINAKEDEIRNFLGRESAIKEIFSLYKLRTSFLKRVGNLFRW